MQIRACRLFAAIGFTLMLLASTAGATEHPQVEVTYIGAVIDGAIIVNEARQSDGQEYPHELGFGNGASSFNHVDIADTARHDGQLPEWVEFKWQETSYPALRAGAGDASERYEHAMPKQRLALPYKTQRVQVRERVPRELVKQIIDEHQKIAPYQTADTTLALFFLWTEAGIKFHWQLRQGKLGSIRVVLREGGDATDVMRKAL